MQNLIIAATESTPEVSFDFATRQFALRGESWPENAAAFLTEFQDRIYYGCDICASFNTHQFIFREFIDGLCESGAISETVYRKVCRDCFPAR